MAGRVPTMLQRMSIQELVWIERRYQGSLAQTGTAAQTYHFGPRLSACRRVTGLGVNINSWQNIIRKVRPGARKYPRKACMHSVVRSAYGLSSNEQAGVLYCKYAVASIVRHIIQVFAKGNTIIRFHAQ